MKYLITGGCGFIGAYTARYLAREGHELVILDRNPDTGLLLRVLAKEKKKNMTVITGDTTDLEALMGILKDQHIQRIVHLAYMLTAGSEENPSLAVKVNIQGTTNIFEAAIASGINKVVWASSIAVFGAQGDYAEKFLANDAVHKPRYLYGACKSFCEFLGRYYFSKHKLDNVGLRFSVVYGPGRLALSTRGSGASFASELIEKPAIKDDPCIVEYGDDLIDWLYVEDAARSIHLASLANKAPKRAYTICGDLKPMKYVATQVKNILPRAQIELRPGKFDMAMRHDLSPAEKDIGYRPEFSVKRGVEETIKILQGGF